MTILDFHVGVADFMLQSAGWDWKGDVYEPDVANAILRFVKPGDVCVDAGANLGFHTLLMASLAGPTGQVIAFEPDPDNFARLRANVELNDYTNVIEQPIALWSANLIKEFFCVPEGGYSSFLHYTGSKSIAVKAMTLDDAINIEEPVRLVKIDCEGAEEQILYGGEQLFTRGVDCVIVEFNFKIMPHFGVSEKRIRRYMDSLGYDFFVLDVRNQPIPIAPELNIVMNGDRFCFNGMFTKRKRQ